MQEKLTEANVAKLKPGQKAFWVSDTILPNFRLNVQPTGSRTYYIVFRDKGKAGSRRIGKAGIITATEARAKAKQILAEWAMTGVNPVQQVKNEEENHTPTIQELTDIYINSGRDKEATIQCLKYMPWLNKHADELTTLEVEQWRIKLRKEKGTKASSVNRWVTCLQAILNYGASHKLIKENPIKGLKKLKPIDSMAKTRYLTNDEKKRFWNALDAMDKEALQRALKVPIKNRVARKVQPEEWTFGSYFKPLIIVAMNTGIRKTALQMLEWSDIDFDAKTITLRAEFAKNRKTSILPMNNTVCKALQAWAKQRQDLNNPFVFPSVAKKNSPFCDNYCAFERLLKRANIQNFRWHDMRHDFASRLVMAGIDLNTVRELMTHSNINMTLRYAHLAPEKKRLAVQALDIQEEAEESED